MRSLVARLVVVLSALVWTSCSSSNGQAGLAAPIVQDAQDLTPSFGDTKDTADTKDVVDSVEVADTADGSDAQALDLAPDVAEVDAELDVPSVDTTPSITGNPMTVQEVRQLPATAGCTQDGTLTVLEGVLLTELVVTAPAETKASLVAVFAQAKGAGPWSGLQLVKMKKDGDDPAFAALKPGDVIHANGKVQTYYCMTQLTVDKWQATGATLKPVADVVALNQIGDQAAAATAEQWEGGRVKVLDVVASETNVLGTDGKGHGEIYVGKTPDDLALMVAPGFYSTPFSSYDTVTSTWTVNIAKGKAWTSIEGVVAWSFDKSRLRPMGALGMIDAP